jgi:hypothetical protein
MSSKIDVNKSCGNFYDMFYRSNIFGFKNNKIFNDKSREYSPCVSNYKLNQNKYKYNTIYYNPNKYYLNSSFIQEQKNRKQAKEKFLPKKEKPIKYSKTLINFRKYGSNLDRNNLSFNFCKKSKLSRLNNSANSSFDEKYNSRGMKILMNQSNIFNSEKKDIENAINANNTIKSYRTHKNNDIFSDYLQNYEIKKNKENICATPNKNKNSFKNFYDYRKLKLKNSSLLIKKKPNNVYEIEFSDFISCKNMNTNKNKINLNKIKKSLKYNIYNEICEKDMNNKNMINFVNDNINFI